jgi:hypothetical protein
LLYLPFIRSIKIFWFFWLNDPSGKIELFLTMLFIPLLINIFIFWMTDNFLMKKNKNYFKITIQGIYLI